MKGLCLIDYPASTDIDWLARLHDNSIIPQLCLADDSSNPSPNALSSSVLLK